MLQKSVLGVFSAPPSFPSCQPGSWPPPKPAVGTGALGRGRDRTPPVSWNGTEAFQEGGWNAPGVAYIGIG